MAGLTPDQLQEQARPEPLIDDVSFDVYLRIEDLDENREFPPGRFAARDGRLDRLRNLWQGDFSDELALTGQRVEPNLFRRYSQQIANLLTMIPPTGAPDGLRLDNVLYDGIVDMTRYGAAVLYYGAELDVVDPGDWYPTRDGGHVIVREYVSDQADTPRPDRLEALIISPDGAETRRVYEWDMGRLGSALPAEADDDEPLEASVLVVPREPRQGIWGTSKYLDIHPAAIEISRRLSRNSRILDMFAAPIPAFRESQFDAEQRFGVPADDPADDRRQKIAEGYLGMLVDEVVHLPADILDMFYLQPATEGVAQALAQVAAVVEDYRDAAGIPNLQGQTLSGEALKRRFVFFYAETRGLGRTLIDGVNRLTGLSAEWEHVFDSDLIFDTSANQT